MAIGAEWLPTSPFRGFDRNSPSARISEKAAPETEEGIFRSREPFERRRNPAGSHRSESAGRRGRRIGRPGSGEPAFAEKRMDFASFGNPSLPYSIPVVAGSTLPYTPMRIE
jgi:hypothetical protein